jgi:hypothetical protein
MRTTEHSLLSGHFCLAGWSEVADIDGSALTLPDRLPSLPVANWP